MFFSIGILHSAREFIERVKDHTISVNDFTTIFQSFHVASSELVLRISQKCDWVRVNTDGNLILGDNGKRILTDSPLEDKIRLQLKHAILAVRPPWSAMIPKGRYEAIKCFPKDIVQCFDEANLLCGHEEATVKWWDELAKAARGNLEDRKLEVGRIGERLSIEHEFNRTGTKPNWSAIESNFLGYDILSVVDTTNHEDLRIEVKTCDATIEDGCFYLTRNEWLVAETSSQYLFHLWSLKPEPNLLTLLPSQLKAHVPCNNGSGEWDITIIPFSIV
jgi:Protein NO VEIN, C-terminal